jgi:hypothetical protein
MAECRQFQQNRVKSAAESEQVRLFSATRKWYPAVLRIRFPDWRGSDVSPGTVSSVSGVAGSRLAVMTGKMLFGNRRLRCQFPEALDWI